MKKLYTLLILIFTLVGCASKPKSTVHILNNASTDQPLHFNCRPLKTATCPYTIPKGKQATFKQVTSIIVIYQEQIYVINFPHTGSFELNTQDILAIKSRKVNLHSQCKNVEIYGTNRTISCKQTQ